MKKLLVFIAVFLFANPNFYVKDFNKAHVVNAGGGFKVYELINSKNDPVNPGFSIALAKLKPNSVTKPHYLNSSNQVAYILKGNGVLYINNKPVKVKEKMSIYIAPKVEMYVKSGDKGLEFLVIVSPAWRSQDEIIKN